MNKLSVNKIVLSALISAIYFVMCFFEGGFAFGAIQCRLAEGLMILPLFFQESIIGLTIGCFLFNLTCGSLFDVIFGTLASFIACILTYIIGKHIKNDWVRLIIGGLPPVVINAIIIPLVLIFGYGETSGYFFLMGCISLGQLIAVYLVGIIIYFPLKKVFKKFNLLDN